MSCLLFFNHKKDEMAGSIHNVSMLLCVFVLTSNKIILHSANFIYNTVSFDNVHTSDFLTEVY